MVFAYVAIFCTPSIFFFKISFSVRDIWDNQLRCLDAYIKHAMLCLTIKIWINIWSYSNKVCFPAYRQIEFIISEKLRRLNNRLIENTNKMSVNNVIQCLIESNASAVRHVVQMTYFNDSIWGFEELNISKCLKSSNMNYIVSKYLACFLWKFFFGRFLTLHMRCTTSNRRGRNVLSLNLMTQYIYMSSN